MAKSVKHVEKSAHAEAMLGDIPPGVVEAVPLERCYSAGNYRESIKTDLGLLKSLLINGQLPTPVPAGSLKDDGRVLILCGNRRLHHMKLLSDPAQLEAALAAFPAKERAEIIARPFPTYVVLVYRGLTEAQENRIRNDDINPLALNQWEKYQKVLSLFRAGLTSRVIESQFGGVKGFSHGSCERLLWIGEMSQEVEDDYYAVTHGKLCLGLKQEDYNTLVKAWRIDNATVSDEEKAEAIRNKSDTLPNADKVYFKRFGPASQEVWDGFVKRAEARAMGQTDDKPRAKGRKTSDHEDMAKAFKDAPITSGYARWAAGDESVSLQKLYQAEMALYAHIRKLEETVEQYADRIANLQAECDRLKAENANLRDEIASMKFANAKQLASEPKQLTHDNV